MTEFVVVLALLTGLGILIMNGFAPSTKSIGAVDAMAVKATRQIVADKD